MIYYDNITRLDGPAMTWAMHTVGFLDLQDEAEAAKIFARSHSLYTREPFKTWTESMPGVPGTGNFITGAGGFLQSLINGYGGVRLHFDSLTISNFFTPPESTALEFKGITYLHNKFSLKITSNEATVNFKELSPDHQIKVTLTPSNIVLRPQEGVDINFGRNSELKIEAIANPFGECELKETVLGEEVVEASATNFKTAKVLFYSIFLVFLKKLYLS